MQKSKFKYLATTIMASLVVLLSKTIPALALPGHSIQQIKQWANQSEFLLNLEEVKDTGGQVDYVSQRKTPKGSIIKFTAHVDSKAPDTVNTETLSIYPSDGENGNANKLEYFDKNHKKIFGTLIDTIYGNVLLPDYEGSDLEVKLEIEGIRYYYKGKRYGYLIAYNLGKYGCQSPCQHVFSINIYDLKSYQQAVTAGRNQKKEQPVNVNIFPM